MLPLVGREAVGEEAPGAKAVAGPGLIVREKEPENLEFAFSKLDKAVTPNELFFVRNHFALPTIDLARWKLTVEGPGVAKPVQFSYEDLLKRKAETVPATLECAGNGRVFLNPKVRGVNWELGGISHAEWTGVSLVSILDAAGMTKKAVEVVFEGADAGEVKDDPKSPGVIHFTRSLPMEKALKSEVLLAWKMNGKDLTPAHGHPLRAVVPGWYGVSSIKWLQRIVVLDRPFLGFYQSLDYTYFEKLQEIPSLKPITEMQVKSQIARPAFMEVVPSGSKYRVFGAAWAGEEEVVSVEVSSDNGKTWSAATLLDKPIPFSWRLWEFDWQTPKTPGKTVLLCRATDKRGRKQPTQRDPNLRTYMVHHVLPHEVLVG